MDEEYYIDKGIEQGINKGFEQGSIKKEREIVINMHNKGIAIDTIAECSGLSISDVEKIINSEEKK